MAIEPGQAARLGDEVQRRRYAAMTPEEKLRVAVRLYWTARQLKEAHLRALHPDLDDREIRRLVNESFLYARD
jgi:hypothetical protein